MDRAGAGASHASVCAACAAEQNGHVDPASPPSLAQCSRCGAPLAPAKGTRPAGNAPNRSPPPGGLVLLWRNLVLRLLARLYWFGTFLGTLAILALGGLVPVVRGWLGNEIDGWSDVVATLGGVWFTVDTQDPDSDLGPVLARVDAPLLFSTIDTVGRRLGVKPPGQVRLTYLPCCGVVAWGRSRAFLIGLPLFRVLTQGELRAIVAHELAHLARGDATLAARSARFVEGLEQAVERNGPRVRGPLAPGRASACARHPG